MAHIVFIGKGKVDGREYDHGNTLDVDEATKSRLLKEGCIESDGGDCSELKEQLADFKTESVNLKETIKSSEGKNKALQAELETAKVVIDGKVELVNTLLKDLDNAKTIAEFKALQTKYAQDEKDA